MAKYFASNLLGGTQQNLSSSYKTILAMFATTSSLRRGKLFDIEIGTDGTPSDTAIVWDLSRQTADGTATGVTPNALDPADVAALSTVKANYTVEGTITANSQQNAIPENQRATYRWCAFPGGEIVWPATANNGLALRAKSAAYASTVVASAYFDEQ